MCPALERAAGHMQVIREPEWFQHRMFKGPETDINPHVFSEWASEVVKMLRLNESDRDKYGQVKRRLTKKEWRHMPGS
jgi:GrpB-like predicted nucleotidyltransferase (UPF0157 family)